MDYAITTAAIEALATSRTVHSWHDILRPQLEEHLKAPENPDGGNGNTTPSNPDNNNDDGNDGIRNTFLPIFLLLIAITILL